MWQVLDPRPLPLGTAIWIVDLGGMGLSDLGSEAFQFFKRMSVEVGMHYPERLHKYAFGHLQLSSSPEIRVWSSLYLLTFALQELCA